MVVAGFGLTVAYKRYKDAEASGASAQAASDQASNAADTDSSDEDALLQEIALASSGSGLTSTPATAIDGTLEDPNFAADLDSSLSALQSAGILADPVPNSVPVTTPVNPYPPANLTPTEPVDHVPSVGLFPIPTQFTPGKLVYTNGLQPTELITAAGQTEDLTFE